MLLCEIQKPGCITQVQDGYNEMDSCLITLGFIG